MKRSRSPFTSSKNLWIIAVLIILIPGCMIVPKRRGDAVIFDRKSFLFPGVDDVVFPWMQLDSGRKYHFEARDLPVYPNRIELRYRREFALPPKLNGQNSELKISREEIRLTNQVWRTISLRIRFESTAGQRTFERVINLEPQRHGPYFDEDRRTVVLQFFHPDVDLGSGVRLSRLEPYLSPATDYYVEVDVASALEKSPIEARLFTEWSVF
jgi:hypothetical protein